MRRQLVVIGASAGGVEALRELVAGLPADLSATVLVVLHLPSGGTSALAPILDRSGPLPAVTASVRRPLRHGQVIVAPPDHHLLVLDGEAVLSRGPTESGHRPAVDALFRSAARARGPQVIGVQLSGALDDGAAGMVAIASAGGAVLVQEPSDALYPGMPESVLRYVTAHHVAPARSLGPLVAALVAEDVLPLQPKGLSQLEIAEDEIAVNGDTGHGNELAAFGRLAGIACPDCDGSLIALNDTDRFRCRVGHAWTAEALLDAQGGKLERALWTAYRMLEEKAAFATRLAQVAAASGSSMESRHRSTAREADEAAKVLRALLLAGLPESRSATLRQEEIAMMTSPGIGRQTER